MFWVVPPPIVPKNDYASGFEFSTYFILSKKSEYI